MTTTATTDERARLERRGRRLEYATTAWNTLEAIVTIAAGLSARSLGLVAFGLDSCVEVFGSLVVLWYLRGSDSRRRSTRAMRLIAVAFVLLAAYLVFESVHSLLSGAQPSRSWLGLVFLVATVFAMVVLAWAKGSTGRALDNGPLVANASMTALDGGLAASTVVAVFVAVQLQWWWADALAAVVVAALAIHEAVDAWRDDGTTAA